MLSTSNKVNNSYNPFSPTTQHKISVRSKVDQHCIMLSGIDISLEELKTLLAR